MDVVDSIVNILHSSVNIAVLTDCCGSNLLGDILLGSVVFFNSVNLAVQFSDTCFVGFGGNLCCHSHGNVLGLCVVVKSGDAVNNELLGSVTFKRGDFYTVHCVSDHSLNILGLCVLGKVGHYGNVKFGDGCFNLLVNIVHRSVNVGVLTDCCIGNLCVDIVLGSVTVKRRNFNSVNLVVQFSNTCFVGFGGNLCCDGCFKNVLNGSVTLGVLVKCGLNCCNGFSG